MADSIDKFREMDATELKDQESQLAVQCFKLRIQKAKGQLENPQRIKMIRRDIARVKTLLQEINSKSDAQAEV